MKILKAYCDGSCYNKTKEGGIGIFIPIEDRKVSIGIRNTSSARAEILALIFTLFELSNTEFHKAFVYTDNQYVVYTIEKGWLDNWIKNREHNFRKNFDLWLVVRNFLSVLMDQGKVVILVWVRGHTGQEDFNSQCNNVADRLANYKNDFELVLMDKNL